MLNSGKVLVAGGRNPADASFMNSCELYDPETESWEDTGYLNTARDYHTVTLLADGKVLVVGGMDPTYGSTSAIRTCELYDPGNGNWTYTGDLNNARMAHTATLLPDGKVLVAGGQAKTAATIASAELYDPVSGKWTLTGTLADPRYWHAATLLRNGQVLISGGTNEAEYLNSTEIYNPFSQKWIAAGSLNLPRCLHTLTLLRNGKVLAAGGYPNDAQSTAEIFSYPQLGSISSIIMLLID
jgi:N-acetylneuraminic acid mutarotase